MRHKKKGSSLNRTQSHRRALVSNMVTSLFDKERIQTTHAKAREIRPVAEKMITFAKRGDLHARRQALRLIKDKEVVAKLFTVIAERFKQRSGGYTRILKMENRLGDNAPMAILELLPEEMKKRAGSRKRRSKKKSSPAAETKPKETQQETAEATVEEPKAEEAKAAEEVTEAPVEETAEAAADETQADEPKEEEKAEAAVTEEAVADAPAEEEKAEAPAEEEKKEDEEKKE